MLMYYFKAITMLPKVVNYLHKKNSKSEMLIIHWLFEVSFSSLPAKNIKTNNLLTLLYCKGWTHLFIWFGADYSTEAPHLCPELWVAVHRPLVQLAVVGWRTENQWLLQIYSKSVNSLVWLSAQTSNVKLLQLAKYKKRWEIITSTI